MKRPVPPAQFRAKVVANHHLSGGYFQLDLEASGDVSLGRATPGQFVMVRGPWGRDLLNGRAFSVLEDRDERCFSILGKVFGRGTALLHAAEVGSTVTVTGPLGRGFPRPEEGTTQLLVAGGVGLPPLHLQARRASEAGHASRIEMFYGGRSSADLVLREELEGFGAKVVYATEDGSVGHRGFVTAPLVERLATAKDAGESVALLACGPTPMLQAVRKLALEYGVPGFLCLEEQMACGFGVCLGCAVPVYGELPYRYCCTDGPVFDAREVRWS
jgi:dihydroorotate dehydrogenase electron transfer subunit